MTSTPSGDLAALAEKALRFLAAHHADSPVVLPNAWDAASARAVQEAGFGFVATSSHAVAQVLGGRDDDSIEPDLAFDWVARIARAVTVPVTADLEGGYRLTPAELVDRLLGAGAVGCNLEDSDHHGGGVLVDAGKRAAYLAQVRSAAEAAGVHVVVNARIDTFIRRVGDPDEQLTEAIRRGRLYLNAGADCVYPIMIARPDDIRSFISTVPGPVNVLAGLGGQEDGLGVRELKELGAARISLGSGLFEVLTERLRGDLRELR